MRWDERPSSSLHHVSAAESSASWLILADREGVGEALAELLGQRGDKCHLAYAAANFASSGCKRWSINPACREDFHQLVQEVYAAQQHRFQGAIYLWGLDMPSMQDMTLDQLEVAEAVGTGSALFLTQALAQARSLGTCSPRLWFVTRNAQKQGTASAPTQAVQAPLWGLGRVASLEYPQMWGGLIDLPPAEPVPVHKDATALLAEVLRSDREDQVVLRDVTRFVPRFVRLPPESPGQDAMLFRYDATYMITGGLGILGLKVAQWLVQQKGIRYLVLIGRRDAQGSTRDAVKGLEALGARVHIMQADISVEADVQRVIEAIQQQLPALKGVIHCAGVLDDGVLSQMDWQKFTRATAPKIKGSWLLHSYTQHMQLDFFVLFSSLVSLTGAAGQANYTAGNAFLDALVAYRHAIGLPAQAIQWGPWDDGGMATASGSRGETLWRARGMKYIPPEDGMHVFDYLLRRRVDHAAVTITDWSVYVEQFPECPPVYAELAREVGPQSEKKRANEGQDVQTRLRLASKPEQRAILVDIIRQQVMDELGLQETFDTRQPLNELGLDSLMSVNLVNRLEAALGISIPVVQLIQGPNLDQFIDDLFPDLERLLDATHTTETDAPTYSATSPSTTTSPEPVTTSKTAGNSWLVFPKPNAVATIRLFCFPFAGGGAATYRSWGEALHPSIEVVAIDPPGRASRIHEPPINTFKAFLRALIPAMVPYLDKPCAFFGHCLGGLTLFETARNLFKHHQLPLKQIFVSGSRPPHRILQDGPFEESLMGKLLKHDKFDPFLLTHEQPDEVFADVIRHFNIGATEEFLRAPALRHLLLPAIRAEFDMAFHYRFTPEPPWDVPITCFTGLDDTYVTREDAMAWHQFTKVAFRVHMREGAHFMVVEDKDFILETINRELCS
jgi:surfactin synthase thioesterase subunit/NAD(P)-dependent dehydrogenase (short-subunit alcohol dehydrogenase family)/acyl carrier protein